MKRHMLQPTIRAVGSQLGLAVIVLACAAYGSSQQPQVQQSAQATVAITSSNKGCFVHPAHALVDTMQEVRFVNATRGPVELHFPTGETLFADGTKVIPIDSVEAKTPIVVAAIGTEHPYAVFCEQGNELAEGLSHPSLIVK